MAATLVVTTPQSAQVNITPDYDSLDNFSDIVVHDTGEFNPYIAAVYALEQADRFHNHAGASIVATGGAFAIDIDSNSGTEGNLNTLINDGLISSDARLTITANQSIYTIVNNGLILNTSADPYSYAVAVSNTADLVINNGTIQANSIGFGSGNHLGTFINNGTITAGRYGIWVIHTADSIVNYGTIEGGEAAVYGDHGYVTNAGTLRALNGAPAVQFYGGSDDRLTLLTGSRIFGPVYLGGQAGDTLDFSAFAGNTILDVPGLGAVVPGSRNYAWDHDNGRIAIFDLSAAGAGAIGASLSDIALSVNDLVADHLGGNGAPSLPPTAYAEPAPSPAEAATRQVMNSAPADESATNLWGGLIGGGSVISMPDRKTSVFGGLFAGSHAAVTDTLTLGGLAGYVQSSAQSAGSNTLASRTAIAGVYGKTALRGADIDFSFLGGVSFHTSAREVVANSAVETATGLYNSFFVAPGIGVTLPALAGMASNVRLKGSASYVVGLTSAYTETGSSMNLAVGTQAIGVLDARFGPEWQHSMASDGGRSVSLSARGGVLAQANFGQSMPVTVIGQTIEVTAPGSAALGLYGGVGFDAAVGRGLAFGGRLDSSVRTDGMVSGAARLALHGTY